MPTQNFKGTLNNLTIGDLTVWTPVDGSGAGLAFTSVSGYYIKIGSLIVAQFSLTYPATADATAAKIGGLPFACSASTLGCGGFPTYQNSGLEYHFFVAASASSFGFRQNDSTQLTNAQLSGKAVRGVVVYFT